MTKFKFLTLSETLKSQNFKYNCHAGQFKVASGSLNIFTKIPLALI